MSVVAATKTPTSKLKKASAVLLLIGVSALLPALICAGIYNAENNPSSYSINSTQNVVGTIGALLFLIAWPSLFASLVVRIVAAIKA